LRERGWGGYTISTSFGEPYNITVSYAGRPLGRKVELGISEVHSVNSWSPVAQWGGMISIYKSVNHYSPDVLFVSPLVGNCVLVKRLLESGPVKPKLVTIAINPLVPPPIELAPDYKNYREMINTPGLYELAQNGFDESKAGGVGNSGGNGVNGGAQEEIPPPLDFSTRESVDLSKLWMMQCSLQTVQNLMRKTGYELDHVEHLFAVFMWKKVYTSGEDNASNLNSLERTAGKGAATSGGSGSKNAAGAASSLKSLGIKDPALANVLQDPKFRWQKDPFESNDGWSERAVKSAKRRQEEEKIKAAKRNLVMSGINQGYTAPSPNANGGSSGNGGSGGQNANGSGSPSSQKDEYKKAAEALKGKEKEGIIAESAFDKKAEASQIKKLEKVRLCVIRGFRDRLRQDASLRKRLENEWSYKTEKSQEILVGEDGETSGNANSDSNGAGAGGDSHEAHDHLSLSRLSQLASVASSFTIFDSMFAEDTAKEAMTLEDANKKLLQDCGLPLAKIEVESAASESSVRNWNPPLISEGDNKHVEDVCLMNFYPNDLQRKWLNGWYCSPSARVIVGLEFSLGVDPSPMGYCGASGESNVIATRNFNNTVDASADDKMSTITEQMNISNNAGKNHNADNESMDADSHKTNKDAAGKSKFQLSSSAAEGRERRRRALCQLKEYFRVNYVPIGAMNIDDFIPSYSAGLREVELKELKSEYGEDLGVTSSLASSTATTGSNTKTNLPSLDAETVSRVKDTAKRIENEDGCSSGMNLGTASIIQSAIDALRVNKKKAVGLESLWAREKFLRNRENEKSKSGSQNNSAGHAAHSNSVNPRKASSDTANDSSNGQSELADALKMPEGDADAKLAAAQKFYEEKMKQVVGGMRAPRNPDSSADSTTNPASSADSAGGSLSSAANSAALVSADYFASSQPLEKELSLMQSYSARVIYEKPMLKYFIERYDRGRCIDGECECFPPHRGPTCELIDGPRLGKEYDPDANEKAGQSANSDKSSNSNPDNSNSNSASEDGSKSKDSKRARACLHYIMPETEGDMRDIEISLPSVWRHFNSKFDYPVIIFHEGMSEKSRLRIVKASPNRIWFSYLGKHFATMESIPEMFQQEILSNPQPFSLGYRQMIRWRSGPIFNEPILQRFDYGMTLDTDSFFPGDWPRDPFVQLQVEKKVAAFPHLGRESASVVINFLFYYLLYAKMYGYNPRRTKLLASLVEKNWKWYQQTFMSDIEILYLPWFRGGEYQDFFRYMDATGGFWTYRWGEVEGEVKRFDNAHKF